MPIPTTAKWPKPRSEDEFEDIAVDFLRLRWKDQNAARTGRRGQRQHGVDVVGRPSWLKGALAGAQCKNTDKLSLDAVMKEVEKAKSFPGGLSEFYVLTSADRDATLQATVRQAVKDAKISFHVEIVFWPDMTNDLSEQPALVEKYWKGFSITPRQAPFPPPSNWLSRESAREDETSELQFEMFLWAIERSDATAGELARELASELQKLGGGVIPRLVSAAPMRREGNFIWAGSFRPYGNVFRKWEVQTHDGGVFVVRSAIFRTGTLLFDVAEVCDDVLVSLLGFVRGLEQAVGKTRGSMPTSVGLRLSMRSSGRPSLQDPASLTTSGMFTVVSSDSWSVDLQAPIGADPIATTCRLMNRAMSNFAPESDEWDRAMGLRAPHFIEIDEGALRRVVKRLG